MKEKNTFAESTYTPKKIRNILFVVGLVIAILLFILAAFSMFKRDMNFWEYYQGLSVAGNIGNVIDFDSAEAFAMNEAVVYIPLFLIFAAIGLIPGIAALFRHKINPTKHLTYTSANMVVSITITIIFVAAVLLCNPLFSQDVFFDDGIPDMSASVDKNDIWYEAQRIVRDRLKAPSTAEFCYMSEATITKKGDSWTVKGYVDAENSFGARLRNKFTVVITFTDSTHYTIDQCDIYT